MAMQQNIRGYNYPTNKTSESICPTKRGKISHTTKKAKSFQAQKLLHSNIKNILQKNITEKGKTRKLGTILSI